MSALFVVFLTIAAIAFAGYVYYEVVNYLYEHNRKLESESSQIDEI